MGNAAPTRTSETRTPQAKDTMSNGWNAPLPLSSKFLHLKSYTFQLWWKLRPFLSRAMEQMAWLFSSSLLVMFASKESASFAFSTGMNAILQKNPKKPRAQCAVVMMIFFVIVNEMSIYAGARFAPRSRSELVPSTGTGGVFGCIGSCGRALSSNNIGASCSSSSNGPWESGTGKPCQNAATSVPVGQGSGTYESIGSWDVSRIADLTYSKFRLKVFHDSTCLHAHAVSIRDDG